jgi:hypothetical protein
MSKHGGPFPTEDAEFNEYLQRAEPHLITHWDRLVAQIAPGIPVPAPASPPIAWLRKAELIEMYGRWNTTYPLTQNPDVRNKTNIDDKEDIKQEIQDLLRYIYADIPNSWLNNRDRNILGLPKRDKEPSPHPQIVDPIIGLTAKTGGDVELRVRKTTDETRPSKPLDHLLVQAQYAFTAATDLTAPPFEQCTNHYESSHALSTMHLGISNVGKRFYGYFRWYDPIHPEDSGPWTQAHNVVVA